jgi:hypothetical protein
LAVRRAKYQVVFPAGSRIAVAIFALSCVNPIFQSP